MPKLFVKMFFKSSEIESFLIFAGFEGAFKKGPPHKTPRSAFLNWFCGLFQSCPHKTIQKKIFFHISNIGFCIPFPLYLIK